MDKSKIENAINHITSLQEKLCYCENNRKHSANPVFPPLKVLLSFA